MVYPEETSHLGSLFLFMVLLHLYTDSKGVGQEKCRDQIQELPIRHLRRGAKVAQTKSVDRSAQKGGLEQTIRRRKQ